MTFSPEIFDWPASIVPSGSVFMAGGQARPGGLTLTATKVTTPEPGGRAALRMEFNTLKTKAANRIYSWLVSKMKPGHVFRVPLYRSDQLVPASAFGLTDAAVAAGVPWEGDIAWSGGAYWSVSPVAATTAAAVAGSVTVMIDLSAYGEVLQHGHVIGHMSRAYLVEAISYDGSDIATVTVSPPLRVAVNSGDLIVFRPTALMTAPDAASFETLFSYGHLVRPRGVTLIEALV